MEHLLAGIADLGRPGYDSVGSYEYKMAILDWLLKERRTITLDELDKMMDSAIGGGESSSGMLVTPTESLSTVAVFACVRVLAETIAMLPLITYRRLAGGGKARATDHRLYRLLHDAANPEMTSYEFRVCMVGQCCTWGNAYAQIEISDNGPKALWPLRSDRMTVKRTPGGVLYLYKLPGETEPRKLPASQILHFRGLSSDGILGYSPIALAREAVGLSMATERYAARFFGNDSRPGGVLQHPAKLTPEAAKRLKDSWEAAHRGVPNSSRVAVLEEGVTWQSVGIPPADAQFLESRRFQVEEIARLFRVPPHMLADLERATFSNVEELGLEFVMFTLMPWLVSFEQRIHESLFRPDERDTYFAEHLVSGLLRGDMQSRYAAYQIGRMNGWLSADDIRELENMNPLPDGDGKSYWMPANMLEIGAEPPPPPVAQVPAETPPTEDTGTRALPAGDEYRAGNASRKALSESFSPIFQDFSARIVRRERADVLKAAQKHLTRLDQKGFNEWADAYYQGDMPVYMEGMMLPGLTAYGSQIAADAARQIRFAGLKQADLERFASEYTRSSAAGHAAQSRGQLAKALTRATEQGSDPFEAVSAQLDDWGEKGADRLARNQIVQARGAFATQAWRAGGVKTLVWRSSGGKNCPFCQQMDGKTAGIDEGFASEGGDVGDGNGQQMAINKNIRHEPLHDSCTCQCEPA
jgi:HK97 family phage portal protein